jgi:hypothetical protein
MVKRREVIMDSLNVGELNDLIEALIAYDKLDEINKMELLTKLQVERQNAIREGRGVGLE